MTTEEFNALPEEARRYIENQKICLSCGKSLDMDAHYKNYLKMKNSNLFTLRVGAVSFTDAKTKKAKVLYPLNQNDTEEQRKEKLENALKLYEARPDKFDVCNVSEIEKILKGDKPAETAEEKAARAAAKKAEKEAAAAARAAAKNGNGKADSKDSTEEEETDEKIDHVVTEQDLIDYPELAERGVKVGDTVKRSKE